MTDGSSAGLIQTLVNMCLTAQDLSRLGRPVPAPPSPESEYIPAVDSRWVLLSTDRCAAKCRENRPSRDLRIASRHFLPFSIPCISRAEDSDAGYDRDDDWKPKVGTDNI